MIIQHPATLPVYSSCTAGNLPGGRFSSISATCNSVQTAMDSTIYIRRKKDTEPSPVFSM